MPRSARVFAALLGALFVVLAGVVVAVSEPLTWQPALGALLVLVLGLDLLRGAARGRWPVLASILFLP